MKLSDIGEFGLIDRIRKKFTTTGLKAPISIGDDAAALCVSSGKLLLVTTDMLVEGVHFDFKTTDCYSLGWKAAAVNLSDIAAMGGTPRYCLTGLAIPRRITVEQITGFYRGFSMLMRKHNVFVVGGDTCGSKRDFMVSVAMLGEVSKKQILVRSGARPGDVIFVTGTLGDSGAGLELLRERGREKTNTRYSQSVKTLVDRHLRPVPRVAWGEKLAASGLVTAMIDISDGLSSDLGHICTESGVGAKVFAQDLPISKQVMSLHRLRRPSLDYALSGGEDYELLFTVPSRKARIIKDLPIKATAIGLICPERTRTLVGLDGKIASLYASGYDHFQPQVRHRRPGG